MGVDVSQDPAGTVARALEEDGLEEAVIEETVIERDIPRQDLVADYRIDFTRLLYLLYIDLEQQIARADTKAQIVLSANALLIAAVANLGLGLGEITLDSLTTGEAVAVGALTLMLGAAMVSVYSALRVAFPRLIGSGHKAPDRDRDLSLYFSGHIAGLDADAYVARFLDLTLHDVKEQVILGIHAKAVIAQRKFADVQRSMLGIMASVVFWAVAQVALELL